MPIPVVISKNGLGLPVRAVDGGAPVMQVSATGVPIMVAVVGDAITTNRRFQVSTNNSSWVVAGVSGESSSMLASIGVIVPDGHYYRVLGNVNINEWSELR